MGTYPDDHPQTLAELIEADPGTITSPLAWELRHQAVSLTQRHEKHYITDPWQVLNLITKGYVLHPWTGAWKSYALSGDRQPILTPSDTGTFRYQAKATRLIPKADDLPALPRPERHGKQPGWLLCYGGTPEVLSKPGVARGLASLASRVPVVDVVFYHVDPDQNIAPTLWSVRAGCGMSGTSRHGATALPFPDTSVLEEVRSAL